MKKILYIEDNKDTADAVQALLLSEGFEADTAPSGKEGIKKAKKYYDLMLLDIMLPDMSGWDIFQTLRKKLRNTKYIFLSVIPVSTERLEELKKAGISDYITKPFEANDLLAKIKKALK